MVLFPLFYHPVGEGIPSAHRAGATIQDVLTLIQRDAPAAFAQWVNVNLSDRYEEGYSAGYSEGYSDCYEMR